MLLQTQEIRASGKSTDEIVAMLVKQVNTLSSQLNYALQNIGAENIVTESGASLEDLYAMGALNGADGKDGTNGIGVPTGGNAGQILSKKTNSDFDTEWIDVSGGSGGSVLPIAIRQSYSSILSGATTISITNITVKKGDYILAGVTARSAVTFNGFELLSQNKLSETNFNQSCALYGKIAEADETITVACTQATANRFLMNVIVLKNAKAPVDFTTCKKLNETNVSKTSYTKINDSLCIIIITFAFSVPDNTSQFVLPDKNNCILVPDPSLKMQEQRMGMILDFNVGGLENTLTFNSISESSFCMCGVIFQ